MFTIDNRAGEFFIQQYLPRRSHHFLDYGGLTLWEGDEMRPRCHLIVSSLSRFVNTPSNVIAVCRNGEYCVVQFRHRSESRIVECASILVRGHCRLRMQCSNSAKRSSSMRCRINYTRTKGRELFGETDRSSARLDSVRESSPLLTPCPCGGESESSIRESCRLQQLNR
jgi:hypothetical protein